MICPSLYTQLVAQPAKNSVLCIPKPVLASTSTHTYHPFLLHYRYLGDGRFHLESVMIANPNVPAYRYGLSWVDQLGRGWNSLPPRFSIGKNLLIPLT